MVLWDWPILQTFYAKKITRRFSCIQIIFLALFLPNYVCHKKLSNKVGVIDPKWLSYSVCPNSFFQTSLIYMLWRPKLNFNSETTFRGLKHNDTQQNGLISDTQHYWHSAEQHSACGKALFIVILSVIMLNVVMLNVVMLNVVAPSQLPHLGGLCL